MDLAKSCVPGEIQLDRSPKLMITNNQSPLWKCEIFCDDFFLRFGICFLHLILLGWWKTTLKYIAKKKPAHFIQGTFRDLRNQRKRHLTIKKSRNQQNNNEFGPESGRSDGVPASLRGRQIKIRRKRVETFVF